MQTLLRSDPAEVAGAHLAAGRTGQAKAIYEQVLREQPRHARALCGLGAIALRSGEIARAFELIGHAVAAAPTDALALGNLAVVYQARGELDRAEACLRRALDLDSSLAELHSNFASLMLARGEPRLAETAQRHAIALAPDAATQRYNLANLLVATDRRAEAAEAYRSVLEIDPGHVGALNNLAILHKQDGHLDVSETLLDEALLRDPMNPELLANHADMLLMRGRRDAALATIRWAVGLSPMNPRLREALGAVLLELGRLAEAGKELAGAMRAEPRNPGIALNLARVLRRQGNLDGAQIAANRAAEFQDGAGPALTQATELLLLRGQYGDAWDRFETLARAGSWPLAETSLADGVELAGVALRLVSMSAADSLFAARFVAGLAARGALVTVICPPVLAPLMVAVRGVSQVEAAETVDLATLAADSRQTLLLDSLPWRLRVTPDQPPVRFPIFDLPARADFAPPGNRAPRIGVWWEGPGPGAALPEALSGFSGIDLVAMRSGGGNGFDDFRALAEAVQTVDVMITPDGPVAHLAASLGIPTWVLVGRDGAWFWPHGGRRSDWYPSSRAFPQATDGTWTAALDALLDALATLSANATSHGEPV